MSCRMRFRTLKKRKQASLYCAIAITAAFLMSICDCRAQSTVLPTEINRQTSNPAFQSKTNRLQLKILEKLPSALYVDSNVESSFRIETNPFQNAPKRSILRQLSPPGTQIDNTQDAISIHDSVSTTSVFNNVFRVNPNLTVGWSPSANTQYFANYFYIRDSLMHSSALSSNTQAVGLGAQHTFQLSKKIALQPQIQVRELFQTEQLPVLDYLPAITLTVNHTENLMSYVNAMLQARFKYFVAGPMRELDPFITWGHSYQKGPWYFSVSTTLNQNFRRQFGRNALLPVNNYSFISDFEIDRQVKSIPGAQLFVRAEPIWNFHSNYTNGLSGMDFRLYYGLRISASKPALTGTIDQLRKRYEQAATKQQ